MTYTPVELRHVQVRRSLLGYRRRSVENLLDEVAESFESVWRDRGDLAEKVEALEEQLDDLKAREQLLIETLAAAEQVAGEVREHAKREAESILEDAHRQARSVWLSAQGERERLFAETKRIEVYLRSALESLAEGAASVPAAELQEPLPLWPREEAGGPAEPAAAEPGTDALDRALAPDPEPRRDSLRRFLPKVVGGDPRDPDWS